MTNFHFPHLVPSLDFPTFLFVPIRAKSYDLFHLTPWLYRYPKYFIQQPEPRIAILNHGHLRISFTTACIDCKNLALIESFYTHFGDFEPNFEIYAKNMPFYRGFCKRGSYLRFKTPFWFNLSKHTRKLQKYWNFSQHIYKYRYFPPLKYQKLRPTNQSPLFRSSSSRSITQETFSWTCLIHSRTSVMSLW